MTDTNKEIQDMRGRIVKEGKDVAQDLVGLKDWKRSKIGALTGVSAFFVAAKNSFGGPVSNLGLGTIRILKRAFGRETVVPLEIDTDDASERFEAAKERYGRTDADLVSLTKASSRQALVYFVAMVLSVCWGIYLVPTTSQQLVFPIGYLFPFFLVFPTFALFLRASFYNWQIRTRRLGSFDEFLKSGEVLLFSSGIPNSANEKRMSRKAGLGILLLVALSAAYLVPAGFALAQGAGSGASVTSGGSFSWTTALPDDDLFHQLLRFVIPNVGPIGPPLEGAPSPYVIPLANAFSSFNSTILLVGSAMLGWFVLAGTVASAHEGKVLGNRWHYIWAPVRVTAGIGFLAPVAGGWCAAQLLVLQLIVWGGGMANTVWVSYVSSFADKNGNFELTSLFGDYKDPSEEPFLISSAQSFYLMRDIASKAVCYAAVDRYDQNKNEPSLTKGTKAGHLLHGLTGIEWGIGTPILTSENFPPPRVKKLGSSKRTTGPVMNDGTTTDREAIVRERDALEEELSVLNPHISPGLYEQKEKELDDLNAILDGMTGDNLNPDQVADLIPEGVEWIWDFGPLCGQIILKTSDPSALIGMLVEHDIDYQPVIDTAQDHYDNMAQIIENYVMPEFWHFATTYVNARDQGIRPDVRAMAEHVNRARRAYENAANRYANQIFDLIKSSGSETSADFLLSEAKKKGWASSGVFYMTLSRLQGSMFSLSELATSSTNIDPSVIDQEGELYLYLFGTPTQEDSTTYGMLTSYADSYETMVSHSSFDERALRAGAMTPTSNSYFQMIMDRVFGQNMKSMVSMFTVSPQNPMVDMVAFGHRLLYAFTIALGIWLGVAALSAGATGVLGAIPLAGSVLSRAVGGVAQAVLSTLTVFVKFVLFIILILGITHAYILPMIPYIMVLFFVVGMLTLTVEALVAAPLWAFFHIRMDGQDFVDQVQRPGYMIAFNLLLRPSLAIMGLILSYSVFGAMVWFLSMTFYPATVAATAGSGYGVLGVITMIVILSYLHWQLAIRSFSLITSVPDRVTRWFGQGGENLGEENEATKSTQFLVGNITNRTERGIAAFGIASGGGGGGGGKNKEKPDKGDDKKTPGDGDSETPTTRS